ncbi:hypothetical protein Fmac_014627 [Flemingia macrophylla]|uniref:Uncharacterized protein n=1 Tax=Flemingia macrophylla TaxID=520843 RepID=A0ABD1MC93_9FABA
MVLDIIDYAPVFLHYIFLFFHFFSSSICPHLQSAPWPSCSSAACFCQPRLRRKPSPSRSGAETAATAPGDATPARSAHTADEASAAIPATEPTTSPRQAHRRACVSRRRGNHPFSLSQPDLHLRLVVLHDAAVAAPPPPVLTLSFSVSRPLLHPCRRRPPTPESGEVLLCHGALHVVLPPYLGLSCNWSDASKTSDCAPVNDPKGNHVFLSLPTWLSSLFSMVYRRTLRTAGWVDCILPKGKYANELREERDLSPLEESSQIDSMRFQEGIQLPSFFNPGEVL